MKRKIHCIMNRKSNLVISQNFPKLTSNNKIVKGNLISELFFSNCSLQFQVATHKPAYKNHKNNHPLYTKCTRVVGVLRLTHFNTFTIHTLK